jgi:hypothetical protein
VPLHIRRHHRALIDSKARSLPACGSNNLAPEMLTGQHPGKMGLCFQTHGRAGRPHGSWRVGGAPANTLSRADSAGMLHSAPPYFDLRARPSLCMQTALPFHRQVAIAIDAGRPASASRNSGVNSVSRTPDCR